MQQFLPETVPSRAFCLQNGSSIDRDAATGGERRARNQRRADADYPLAAVRLPHARLNDGCLLSPAGTRRAGSFRFRSRAGRSSLSPDSVVDLPRGRLTWAGAASSTGSTGLILSDASHSSNNRQNIAAHLIILQCVEGSQEIGGTMGAQDAEHLRLLLTSVAFVAIEERRDWHFKNPSNLAQAAGTDAVHPPLVLLDLLKRYAEGAAERGLREAFGLAQRLDALANDPVLLSRFFRRRARSVHGIEPCMGERQGGLIESPAGRSQQRFREDFRCVEPRGLSTRVRSRPASASQSGRRIIPRAGSPKSAAER